MINRLATRTSRLALFLITMLGLAACGGGGGGGGDDGGFLGPGGGNTDTLFLKISLLDASGNPTNTITTAAPGTLEAKVTKNKASGAPQSNVIVTVTSDVDLLINGTAGESKSNSDADGLASFFIEAGEQKGAGTLTVSIVDQSGVTVVQTVNFQLGASGLRLGYIDGDSFIEGQIKITPDGAVSARGQAELSVAVVDENGDLAESTESIAFRSPCLSGGEATLDPASPIQTSTGKLTATYKPSGCSGTDSITATLVGTSTIASGVIEIAPPSANSLSFESATPNLIVLKGTGGGGNRVEQSTVIFNTTDSSGQPLPDVEVNFSLTTQVGGLVLTPTSAVSDAEGKVRTVVSSGNVATVVRILATALSADGAGEVSAVSDLLTVSTGLPDQNSISLSVSESFVVPEAMTKDGVTRTLTVRMADKFNNPVPDGTSALFTTEYGSIQPSCETSGGGCSVTWTSQAPRLPTLDENQELVQGLYTTRDCPSTTGGPNIPCPSDLGYIRGGRSTVLVTAIGEESFIDRNGNGIFDQAEADAGLFANLTEAFIDHNENGLFDPATEACLNNPSSLECMAGSEEIFSDFDDDQTFDANGDDPTNGYPDQGQTAMYNGLLCPVEGNGVWCSRELLRVFDSAVLILSNDPNWAMEVYQNGSSYVSPSTNIRGNSYSVYVSDTFNNKPPAGSSISISVEDGPCEVTIAGATVVPNTTAPGAFEVQFTESGIVEYDSCDANAAPTSSELTGSIKITLTPQGGGPAFSKSWACRATSQGTPSADPCPTP